MVDFTNAGVLGSLEDFRKYMLAPILRGREPGASDAEKKKMVELQVEMSSTVNDFILRRVNTLNAQHLPPKLVQVVCCNLTPTQQQALTDLQRNEVLVQKIARSAFSANQLQFGEITGTADADER